MFNKVFISYATEDYAQAEKLYDFLTMNGFNPWLDKKSLMPGQLWDFEIKKGLREAHYVILLLSENSVQKRGYVQREFKLALKYWEEKLQDDIYLIPIKLNKCEVPENLNSFQWIELDNERSFEMVRSSLNTQQNKYLVEYQNRLNKKKTFETKSVEDEYLYKNNDINFKIECTSSEFIDNSNQSFREINDFIRGRITNFVLSCRNSFLNFDQIPIETKGESIDWYFSLGVSINHLSNSFISLIENNHDYTGGAHGMTGLGGYNFMLNPNIKFDIRSIICGTDEKYVLEFFSDFCFEKLREEYNEDSFVDEAEKANQTKENLFWEDSLTAKWDNFDNYVISEKSLDIIFNQYQVSSYSFGIRIVEIPYDLIVERLANKDKFNRFLQIIRS